MVNTMENELLASFWVTDAFAVPRESSTRPFVIAGLRARVPNLYLRRMESWIPIPQILYFQGQETPGALPS